MFKTKPKTEKKLKNKKSKKIEKNEVMEQNQDSDLRFNADNEIIIGLRRLPDENVKVNKRTSNKKRKKRKNKETKKTRLARKIAMFMMLLVMIIIAMVIALYSPIFNVIKINVNGNKIISKEKIISLSEIKLNANTFKVKKKKIVDNIKQNSYIEKAEIKRILPNVIEINIEERVPSFVIQLNERFAYINNQGYILEISSEKIEKPIIEGISTKEKNLAEGSRLCNEDLEKLEDVLKIVECCNNNDIGKIISSVNIKERQNYKIGFASQGKTAYIGDISNLTTKVLYIKAIMEKESEGEIFVNVDLNTQNVFFRESV